MAKKKEELSIEEKIERALVPKEEQPYEIPSNWVWTRLGETVELSNGEKEKGEYPYFDVKTLRSGVEERMLKEGKIVNKNDKVILVDGENSGEVFVIPKKGYMGSTFKKLNIFLNEIEEYIKLFLFINKDNFKNNKTGTAIPHLNKELFKTLNFPLPPLEEQQRIVKKVESMLEKLKEAKEIIKGVKEKSTLRKESLLNKSFTGELTAKWREENKCNSAITLLEKINEEKISKWEEDCKLAEQEGKKKPKKPSIKEVEEMLVPKEEQPYEIPSNWVWTRLGEIGKYKKGPFGSTLKKDLLVSQGENTIKVYEQKNAIQKDLKLGNYYVTMDYFCEKLQGFEVFPEDIIVSCAGTIGETYIMPKNMERGIINQALMKITLKKEVYNSYYLNYFDFILKKVSQELSKGTAIKNIPPFDIFKNLTFPLPPLEEQQEIVKILDKVLEKEREIEELCRLEDKLELIEKSILDKAFRGELGTNDLNDEPAIELLRKIKMEENNRE